MQRAGFSSPGQDLKYLDAWQFRQRLKTISRQFAALELQAIYSIIFINL
jgi:hypothetical protein